MMASSPSISASDVDSFIRNSMHNLQALQANLTRIGYRFVRAAGPFQFADDQDRAVIGNVEEQLGHIPLLVRRWYETFRYIDFSQDPAQFHDASALVAGLGYNLSLVFREIESCIQLRDELRRSGIVIDRGEGDNRLLPFGSSASNCEPKGVWLPDHTVDPILYDDGNGPVSFSAELRTAFRSGGFPFW
jgi:hypothetical protein